MSKWIVVILTATLTLGAGAMTGQTTATDTRCTTNGNSTDCKSTTTNPNAQQQQSYEAGRQIGNALGTGIAARIQAHSLDKKLRKYCEGHPNENWTYRAADGHPVSSGVCPPVEDKSTTAAQAFMAKHKNYIVEPANADAMVGYLKAHDLNPTEEKSYELAYNALKKENRLHLYAN